MKKTVVIGGGVAGLTAGIYALERGVGVTLIEKNRSGAGALCGWRRGGYGIDGCLHWLTGTKEGTQLYDIWQKTGMLDGEVVRQEVFFSSETDGVTVHFYDDADRTMEEMISCYPEDGREIAKFIRAVKAAGALSCGGDTGRAQTAKQYLILSPYALISAGELAERFSSRGMRRAICDLTGKYFSSLGLIFAYGAFSCGNGYLPRGGSAGAAKRMVDRFESLGGERLAGRRAVRIINGNGEVEVLLSDGSAVSGECVICCTDPFRAASTLFDDDLTPGRFRRILGKKEKYPLFSSVHFAFAADGEAVPFKGTSFFPCERHGVGSVNRDRMMLKEYSHERSFAPEGKTVLQTMIFTDEAKSRDWISLKKSGGAYTDEKKRAAEEVKERILRRYPSLSPSLELLDSWTPATFSRYLGSVCGSYMSFSLSPGIRPASFPMRLKRAPGVVFASGWSRSPGGVPNAAQAGVRAVAALLD